MAVKEYTCPLCGKLLGRVTSTHLRTHGVTAAKFHTLRIERDTGKPIREFLREIYIVQELTTPEIFEKYGLTYRILREIMSQNGMSVRTRSQAVSISWSRDDGQRRDSASKWMQELTDSLDFTGDNNPAKRGEVRRKISRAKKKSNPGLIPMLEARRGLRILRPTSIEIKMRDALSRRGIDFDPEYRVARYSIDFALVKIKVAIECDGAYWHDEDHDAKRDRVLSGLGWVTLRYSGKRIRNNVEGCVDDILTELARLNLPPPLVE
ncbi:DUF559 domain-containing protein [Candidatus Kaiserbacteria bacterium]|nr:DUF559 domain-containing protein [Candidatus Kaiserbacteria bacterium]